MATASPLRETAHAKLNLALHVRARGTDGYHAIETLFAFCEEGDLIEAETADRLSLTIDGPFSGELAEEKSNLVLRAAERMREVFDPGMGARLRLTKNLPVAAGIGGGSADAAATLRLLARLWNVRDPRIASIAAELGADVPACLASRMAIGRGRGDALEPVDAEALAGMSVLLVNPGAPLATGPVFAGWDGRDRGALGDGDPLEAALAGRNDLEASARALMPEIGAVLDALAQAGGARLVRMSGSGATCFALFESVSERDAASASLARAQPSWWRLATRLR